MPRRFEPKLQPLKLGSGIGPNTNGPIPATTRDWIITSKAASPPSPTPSMVVAFGPWWLKSCQQILSAAHTCNRPVSRGDSEKNPHLQPARRKRRFSKKNPHLQPARRKRRFSKKNPHLQPARPKRRFSKKNPHLQPRSCQGHQVRGVCEPANPVSITALAPDRVRVVVPRARS